MMQIHSFFKIFGRKNQTDQANLPIQNIDSIDMISKREDGGIDLIIMANSSLPKDREIQLLLCDKVGTYLNYINSDKFRNKHDNPLPENTHIEIVCNGSVDPVMIDFIDRMKPWAEYNNACIGLRVEEE